MENPDSLNSANPYVLLGQIGQISTQLTKNQLFDTKVTFSLKREFGAKSTLFRENATFGCLFAPSRPGGSKHKFGLTFQALKGSLLNMTGTFHPISLKWWNFMKMAPFW